MIEPRVEMSERLETDLEASAAQVQLDKDAYEKGFSYAPPAPETNGLVTLDERTD